MACKHEGGKEPCIKYGNGSCRIRVLQRTMWRQRKTRSRQYIDYQRQYRKDCRSARKNNGYASGRIGAGCELLVQVDLLRRGYEVTRPISHTAKHDLHVELPSLGWVGVQVRSANRRKSGKLMISHKKRQYSASPVMALVHLASGQISYRPGTQPLPVELQ